MNHDDQVIHTQFLFLDCESFKESIYQIGDYVQFTKPYVGKCPVGKIVGIEYWIMNDLPNFQCGYPTYKINVPFDHSFWRQWTGLIRSTKDSYDALNLLAMLEQ